MHYPDHIDAMWLACDHEGQVAVMLTGGEGPGPSENPVSHDCDSIEQMLLGLPVIGDVLLTTRGPQPLICFELCRRGLFVYHWPDAAQAGQGGRQSYGLICLPGVRLPIEKLPPRARASIYRASVAFGSSFCLRDDEASHIRLCDGSI